jgi:predicted ArsR family transcriptional regulator
MYCIRERYGHHMPSDMGAAPFPLDSEAVQAVASLGDPTRRDVYRIVAGAHRGLTREQVARASGISRKLAAFHLDKLVEAGLLVNRYDDRRRPQTPGRRPKVYSRSPLEIALSLPRRDPAALAALLLEAVSTAGPDESARASALRVSTARGRELGADLRSRISRGPLGAERALTITETALRDRGFEPTRETATTIRLRNCPYAPLTDDGSDLVCDIHHHFVTGLLAGLDARTVHAERALHPGECCVGIRA